MVGKTMNAKNEILRDIRAAKAQIKVAPAPRGYRQTLHLSTEHRLELFTDRLNDYNATVYTCVESDIPRTIAKALEARGKQSLIIPPAFPAEQLPAGFRFIPDDALDYQILDTSEGALTACTAAIAFTGTIILSHGPHEGRRAISLIPDYHLCIVRAAQLVDTVPQGIRALARFQTHPLTTISGPSATADIEMIRVKGVHGPRTLDVIIVE
jgi:L-lactate dehydrogenase complex protein LldG